MMRNLKKFIKEDSFIDNYLKYFESFSTSIDFDFWSAIWVLSSLINRNVIIDRPNNPLYCNLFLNLIANNDNINKDLSLDLMNNILEKINNNNNLLLNKPIYIYELINLMIKHQENNKNLNINYIIKDYIKYLNKKKFFDLIESLYNNPNERTYDEYTYTDKSTYNHYTSLCTSDTFDNYIKTLENDNRLSTKQLTIFETKPKIKIGWGNKAKESNKLIDKGQQIVRKCSKRRKIVLSTEAIRRYNLWYKKRRINNNFINKNYEINEPDLVLKLATILAINYNLDTTAIHSNFIDNAIEILTYYKKLAEKKIKKTIEKDDLEKYEKILKKLQKILKLTRYTGIVQNKLYKYVRYYCSLEEFKYIMTILHELNLVELYMIEKSKGSYYKITDSFYDMKNFDNIYKLIT